MIDLKNVKKAHIIGITSPFHSFVAHYLLSQGVELTASEVKQDNDQAREWINKGILYEGGHDEKYIAEDLDLVIFPNGPIPGNPECEKAIELGLNTAIVPELVGLISRNFKVIAIAGTHGKTTTTALSVWLLYKEYRDLPNFIIGDTILGINKSWNFNLNSEYLVIEADEYKKQFLKRVPSPFATLITNIELDHTDVFKDQEEYNQAFREFVGNTTDCVIVDTSGENILEITKGLDVRIIDTKDIEEEYSDVTAGLVGKHNRENIMKVCGLAKFLGIYPDIEDFPGIHSRFQYIGNTHSGSMCFLDYSHNPRKIRACLQGAKEAYPDKRIVFVWQPHSYERSFSFKDEFAQSLDDANVVLIPNIFAPLREPEEYKEKMGDSEFVDFLKERNPDKDIRYTENLENTAEVLREFGSDHIVVCASAGNLSDIFNLIIDENDIQD